MLTVFQVIASEDWNGMREDFKMASDVITFRVDYAPRVRSTSGSHHELKVQLLWTMSYTSNWHNSHTFN